MDSEVPPGVPTATTPDSGPGASPSLHGRFEPGTRLGTRYRVVGLLGRGGMGDVYRADDLELNQSVALKFLPERVARNPADLARLRQEVRIARLISHPNVCRTYDIAEADGQVFLVMEYVDGEDLAAVLRRMGRPTPEKALEIARQLCLGLGAAHENGVLHRDFKPANIMIDGRGRVRITDFGLAGTAEEIAARDAVEGTPGYMAPEQLETGRSTAQSDIYALGLVLYEIFTGRKASEMAVRPDPMRPESESGVRTPSSLVAGIDPAVERAILRCLERDPARRMQSAYAVFGALPGGDPLAAVVAAGETPSPELVANAGGEGAVRPLIAALAVVATLTGFVAVSFLNRSLYEGFGRPSAMLSARADEILVQTTGKAPPRYSARGYRYAPSPGTGKQFWRRWNPVPLVSPDIHNRPTIDDPPQAYPGSATVLLDPEGRLLGLTRVPDLSDSTRGRSLDWSTLLLATGHDPSRVVPTAPPADFLAQADTLAAWNVSGAPASGAPDTLIAVAAFAGDVVQMETRVGGHPISTVTLPPDERINALDAAAFLIFNLIPFVGSVVLARRNLKAGRSDLRGAIVTGVTVTLLYPPIYLVTDNLREMGATRILDSLINGMAAGHALLHGVGVAIGYLAIEPYVRRLWPNVLVGWARLVSGRWKDPIVGRSILAGAVCGTLVTLAIDCYGYAGRAVGSITKPAQITGLALPGVLDMKVLLGFVSVMLAVALVRVMGFFTTLVLLRYLLRSNRAAVVGIMILFFLFLWSGLETGMEPTLLLIPFALAFVLVAVFLTIRYGFLAAVSMYLFAQLADGLPWTTNLSTSFASQTELSWAIVAVILAYGFFTAVGGKSILRDPLG
jgi:predicted Ser/Thr protein kinase